MSVCYKLHEQKRSVLCNFVELCTAFSQRYSNIKIGFSSFASLRPKQCITVGASGSHSICVCAIHQNAQLLVNTLKLEKDIHELTDLMVCDRQNKNCMMHSCESCPGINALKSYLNQFFINQFIEDNVVTEGTSTDEEINSYFNEAEMKFLQ